MTQALDTTEARHLVDRLRRLHDGDAALMSVVAGGQAVVGPLRDLLSEREPSGIYQPRCWAARALGMIGAFDVLADFLRLRRRFTDAVERAGEDAAINAAARALTGRKSNEDFELLRSIAGEHAHLAGAVEALGAFRRVDAIPELVHALGEDHSRFAAEAALAAIGEPAIPALVETATQKPPHGEPEYDRQARHRRSALRVLDNIGVPAESWSRLRPLLDDSDHWVTALACGLALRQRSRSDRIKAKDRLAMLRQLPDVWLRMHIEDFLEPPRRKSDSPGAAE